MNVGEGRERGVYSGESTVQRVLCYSHFICGWDSSFLDVII